MELTNAEVHDSQADRNKPLTSAQLRLNKGVSPVRAGVEQAFATMKRNYGYRGASYRNRCHPHLMCHIGRTFRINGSAYI